MPEKFEHPFSGTEFREELEQHGNNLTVLPGWTFESCIIYSNQPKTTSLNGESDHRPQDATDVSELQLRQACITARFGGAEVVHDVDYEGVTHVLVGNDRSRIQELREKLSLYATSCQVQCLASESLTWNLHSRRRLPRLVTVEWIEESWKAKTLLDEERMCWPLCIILFVTKGERL